MIVLMEPKASEGQIADVVRRVTQAGFSVRRSEMERVVLGVTGAGQAPEPELLEGMAGVAEVSIDRPEYRLVSRAFQPEDSQVDVGRRVVVGGEHLVVMAGP
jgi:3-deoxy-7-phosphoheptulonate synthase